MDLKTRPSSSESDGENIDSSVKILINDITPCDSREFLHLPGSILQVASQSDLRSIGIRPSKGILQRRSSWSCTRIPKKHKKIQKCFSLGNIYHQTGRIGFGGQNATSLDSHLSNQKEGSTDSIPEGIKEKQRSFSAGSREDVFSFCNQLQDSIQSMNDMISRGSTQLLTTNISEAKPLKKHSLVGIKNAEESWLITPRSTLQKSVSTPSIVAAQEMQEIAHRRGGKDRTYGRNRSTLQNVRNSCIEIMHEDDEPEEMNIKRLSTFSLASLLKENLLKSGQAEDEDKPFSKRKKRGSLFFRKKKNKEKENKKNSAAHQFVSVCFSTAATCDVCNRALANKSALKCETCCVAVHDSSCKDHVPNCVQPKNHQSTAPEKEYNSTLLTPSGSIRYPSRYRNLVGSSSLIHSHSSLNLGKQSQSNKEKRSSVGDCTKNISSSASDSSKSSSSK